MSQAHLLEYEVAESGAPTCSCGGASASQAQSRQQPLEALPSRLSAVEWQALEAGGTWGEVFAGEATRPASPPRSAATSSAARGNPPASTGARSSAAASGARRTPAAASSAGPPSAARTGGAGAGSTARAGTSGARAASDAGSGAGTRTSQGAARTDGSAAGRGSGQRQGSGGSAARGPSGMSLAGFSQAASDLVGTISGAVGTVSSAVNTVSSAVNTVRPIVDLLSNRAEPSPQLRPAAAEPAPTAAPSEPAAVSGVTGALPSPTGSVDEPPVPEPMTPPAPAAPPTPAPPSAAAPLAGVPAPLVLPAAPQPPAGAYPQLTTAPGLAPGALVDPRIAAALAGIAQPAYLAALAGLPLAAPPPTWAQLAAAGQAFAPVGPYPQAASAPPVGWPVAPSWTASQVQAWVPPLPAAIDPRTPAPALRSSPPTNALAALLQGLQMGDVPSLMSGTPPARASSGTSPTRDATALLSLILSNAQVQNNLRRAATQPPEHVRLSLPAATGAARRDEVPLPMNAVVQAIAALAQRSSLELDEALADEADDVGQPAEFLLTESGDLIVDPEDPQRRADLVAHYFRCAAQAEHNHGSR